METAQRQVGLAVELKDVPAQDYLGKRFTADLAAVGPQVQAAFGELYACLGQAKSSPTGPPFLVASEPVGGAMEIEVGAPCRPVPTPAPGLHVGRFEAGRAAVTTFRGPYDQLGPIHASLRAWVGEHGHRPAGGVREVYLNGPGEAATPADYLTELILPID